MRTYTVDINFGGYLCADKHYFVKAKNETEAYKIANLIASAEYGIYVNVDEDEELEDDEEDKDVADIEYTADDIAFNGADEILDKDWYQEIQKCKVVSVWIIISIWSVE